MRLGSYPGHGAPARRSWSSHPISTMGSRWARWRSGPMPGPCCSTRRLRNSFSRSLARACGAGFGFGNCWKILLEARPGRPGLRAARLFPPDGPASRRCRLACAADALSPHRKHFGPDRIASLDSETLTARSRIVRRQRRALTSALTRQHPADYADHPAILRNSKSGPALTRGERQTGSGARPRSPWRRDREGRRVDPRRRRTPAAFRWSCRSRFSSPALANELVIRRKAGT